MFPLHLPIELLFMIAELLALDDVLSFGLTCRLFSNLIYSNQFCSAFLLAKAPYSPDVVACGSTGDFSRVLRTIIKCRNAISSARPFQVAVIAQADDYIYVNGFLCYTVDRTQLRLLNVHESSAQETVIDIRQFLLFAVPESKERKRFRFRPVHYAHGLLTCVYESKKMGVMTRVLVLIDSKTTTLVDVRQIQSVHGLFVRNDIQHVFVGTHSARDSENQRRWVIRHFDRETVEWTDPPIFLNDFEGSQVGAEVCFEIIDGFFYALSNGSIYLDEYWPASFYDALRFPTDKPFLKNIQVASTTENKLWRRNNNEGPIDNRWNSLSLEKDEGTGAIMIVECRKEFLFEAFKSVRTRYKRPLEFDDYSVFLLEKPDSGKEGPLGDDEGSLENDDLSTWPTPDRDVHHGDDVTNPILRSQCVAISYIGPCNTFLDVVRDSEPLLEPRLRLRARARATSTSTEERMQRAESAAPSIWPDWDLHSDQPHLQNHMLELERILSLPSDSIENPFFVDSRSLVYSGGCGKMSPIVFIGFDPRIRIRGLPRFGKEGESDVGGTVVSTADLAPQGNNLAEWARLEEPMYLGLRSGDFGGGFEFGKLAKKIVREHDTDTIGYV